MEKNIKIPTYDQLIRPVFMAIKELGGSGSNEEINNKVIEMEKISDEVLSVIQKGFSSKSAVVYRIEWVRTYLKKFGAINNTQKGVWSITNEFDNKIDIDEKAILKSIREMSNDKKEQSDEKAILDETDKIKNILHKKLLNMNPYDFEKLSGVLLREAGFSRLQITQKSGDGGIDGYGYLNINDFISFKIAFQCKRYQNNVTSKEIRDFRGSMESDIKNGIFITTSDFTKDAKEEAVAKGKQHIDLINGDRLVEKLIELNLGIKKDLIIDDDFFSKL